MLDKSRKRRRRAFSSTYLLFFFVLYSIGNAMPCQCWACTKINTSKYKSNSNPFYFRGRSVYSCIENCLYFKQDKIYWDFYFCILKFSEWIIWHLKTMMCWPLVLRAPIFVSVSVCGCVLVWKLRAQKQKMPLRMIIKVGAHIAHNLNINEEVDKVELNERKRERENIKIIWFLLTLI